MAGWRANNEKGEAVPIMFPVFLNLKGKNAVVFGGGIVAERRIVKLLKSGARVRVVSNVFTKSLKKMGGDKRMEIVQTRIGDNNIKKFLDDADLVVAATNNNVLNDVIEKESRVLGKWVNRADELADFSIPATLELGDATVAISTGGKSPAVAKAMKKLIKRALAEEILQIELQGFARERLKRRVPEQKERKRVLKEIMNSPELLLLLRKGEIERAKEKVMETCDAYHKH